MRHVDEGTIHAWLDGAIADPAETAWIEEHLRWCAACGARVAEERAMLEQAHALLTAAAPAAETPAFEEIAARADRNDRLDGASTFDTSSRQRRWLLQAAWAASLVLAVGIGWLARERADERTGAAIVSQAPAAAPGSTADAMERELPPAIAPQSASSAPPPSREALASSAAARSRMADAAPEAAREQTEGQRAVAPPAAPATAPAEAFTEATEIRPGAPAGAPADAARQGFAASRIDAARPPVAALAEPAAVSNATPVSVVPPAAAETSAWRTLPRTEAAARSGMALYGLDGYEPALTSISGDNRIVRTVYRLESGATVELDQERALPPVAANSLQAAARAPVPRTAGIAADVAAAPLVWSQIRGDVRVSLRTPSVTQDLNALGARLRVE